jgi:hypothetical protein
VVGVFRTIENGGRSAEVKKKKKKRERECKGKKRSFGGRLVRSQDRERNISNEAFR